MKTTHRKTLKVLIASLETVRSKVIDIQLEEEVLTDDLPEDQREEAEEAINTLDDACHRLQDAIDALQDLL